MDHCPISSLPPSFESAESAWFWAIRALRAAPTGQPGPADPAPERLADVIKCLDELYRTRRIEMVHVRIMRIWGVRGMAPNPARSRERSDWRFWHEAMNRMDLKLRARGIVAGTISQDAAD